MHGSSATQHWLVPTMLQMCITFDAHLLGVMHSAGSERTWTPLYHMAQKDSSGTAALRRVRTVITYRTPSYIAAVADGTMEYDFKNYIRMYRSMSHVGAVLQLRVSSRHSRRHRHACWMPNCELCITTAGENKLGWVARRKRKRALQLCARRGPVRAAAKRASWAAHGHGLASSCMASYTQGGLVGDFWRSPTMNSIMMI